MYVVASGFGMLFYRGADIPISSRLMLSPPRLLFLSPTYVNGHVLQPTFQLFFCPPVLRLIENMTQCLKWFESCPNVFAV